MRRCIVALTLVAFLAAPAVSRADVGFFLGASWEYFWPRDSEMFGESMASNSWGRDIAGISYSTGTDRNQFYTFNRPNRLMSPGLSQSIVWDSGVSIELAERWVWLQWAPNRDVDIVCNHMMVPLTLTPRYRFFPGARFHPTISLGFGYYYFNTRISGDDLYDQTRNSNYEDEALVGEDEPPSHQPEPRRYLRKEREFSRSGWYPGYHGGLGFETQLSDRLSFTLEFCWSLIPVKTIDVVRVREGNVEDWHWEEREISGDAGGLHTTLGISYLFSP